MARLSAIYSTIEPNIPIALYEGEIRFGGSPPSSRQVGTLRFDWLPRPNVRIDVPQSIAYVGPGETTLTIAGAPKPARALITGVASGNNRPTSITGFLAGPLDIGSPKDLSSVVFHVPNLSRYLGFRSRVPPEELTDGWAIDRIAMEARGWRITLEAADEADRLIGSLKSVGGYGLTHVGKLERSDGTSFPLADANKLLGVLVYFLSFVQGYWVNPVFPVGYSVSGERCWEQWGPWRFDSWRHRPSRCDELAGDSPGLAFPGFVHRWRDELWHEPTRLGVHWYIEANRGGGDSEPAMILTQAALELLAGTLLVEDLQRVSERDFDNPRKWPAHRKLRETLQWAGIPTRLPDSLHELQRVRQAEGWRDGPHAFTSVRNWLGHPTCRNRAKFQALTSSAITEAWTLGVWYLELLLLRLADYRGPYGSRLTPRFVGEVEPVPWTRP